MTSSDKTIMVDGQVYTESEAWEVVDRLAASEDDDAPTLRQMILDELMPKEIPDELAFARWLQIERGVIGEDVDLAALHAQWNADLYRCNHDPAALRVVEVNRCECGALLPLLADEPEPARTYDHDADPSDDRVTARAERF